METKVLTFNGASLTELIEALINGDFEKQLNKSTEVNKKGQSVDNSNPYAPYVSNIAERIGCHPKKVANILSSLWEIYPAAAFSVLLREIAVVIDKNYEDHISNCEEFYTVSLLDGRICKVCKAHIKNFRNFAAFRTLEDTKLACKILKNDLKEMFKPCGE